VRAGQHERAIEPLRHALERDPNNGELRQLLAMACFNAQKYECSAQLLEGAPLVANDPSLIYALGVSLVRSGRPQAGAQVFSRMITEHAGSAELYVLLGEAHSQQGDFDSALAQFNKAIELDPRVPNAHTSAGLLHLRVGNLQDAVRHFRAELQLRPKDARTRYHLAYALQLQGNSEEAMQHLRETLRLDPGSADARYLLGKALLDGGDATAAVEQLQASIRLAPGDARAHYQLGRAYQRLGRQQDAQRQFALYQELKPKERNP
jgi:Flp pilus assembly protein TadD